MPRKVFTAGEVLAAADVNSFLMDQTVMTFAGTAARGSAIGTATEGMVTYLTDIDALSVYNGTQFITNRPIMTFAGTAARGSAITSPIDGMLTYLEDLDRYDSYQGSWIPVITPGAWISWTPTFTNITVGNGVTSARYIKIGKTVIGYVEFTLGSTSSITTNARFTLPTTSRITWINPTVTYLDSGIIFPGASYMDSNQLYLMAINTAGTYAVGTIVSATIPFTWVTGDLFSATFIYEEV
jgi:hypothetical protein